MLSGTCAVSSSRSFYVATGSGNAGGTRESVCRAMVVQALISPTTTMGRQLAHVLLLLRQHLSADVELLLSPTLELDSVPLTAYYAYAAPAVPADMAHVPAAGMVTLPHVPGHLVLTLNVEAPEAWLVEVGSTQARSLQPRRGGCHETCVVVGSRRGWQTWLLASLHGRALMA